MNTTEANKMPLQATAATGNLICQQDIINPLSKMAIQMASILVVAHLFHLILKLFYNSGPVAHILAGLLLGPVGISRIPEVKDFFSSRSTLEYYPILLFLFSTLFMFHIGLEVDIAYTLRTLKTAAAISYWGLGINFVTGAIISTVLNSENFLATIVNETEKANSTMYGLTIIIYLATTSPPAVARVVAEVKIATSNIGRLAVSCGLINDLSCILLYLFMLGFQNWKMIGRGILALLVTCGSIFLIKYMANWINNRNRSQKYLRNPEFFVLISVLIMCSSLIEALSFSSALNCFLLGLMFPREGRCMRTFVYKLSFFIYNIILPLYFGYIGFQCNVMYFSRWDHFLTIAMIVVLSLLGKIGGSIIACQQLKLPISDGVLVGFLLNLKGHMDLLLLSGVASENLQWTMKSQDMLLTSMVINSAIAGVGVAIFVKKKERIWFALAHRTLEPQDPDDELRVLGGVYSSRHAPPMIAIIAAFRGSQSAPISPYLMHLIELSTAPRASNTALYHELEEYDQLNDEDYGGNDVLEINEAVDACAAETKIFIHQIKVVSSFGAMYEEICDHAEDLRVSLILMPFHKHQRIDGKLESGKDGIRTTNQRVLRHAPCSVGVVVSRGPAGIPAFNQIIGSDTIQQVATLFFGGGDDQEALACSKRLGSHRLVNLTVVRFVGTTTSTEEKVNNMEDDVYFADFYNRYIRSGKVGCIEKHSNNGKETVEILREIKNMYSLFIVGKGRRGHSPLTTGMSDWEECPELGIVGDILASSEFNIGGSVLVIQQHRSPGM